MGRFQLPIMVVKCQCLNLRCENSVTLLYLWHAVLSRDRCCRILSKEHTAPIDVSGMTRVVCTGSYEIWRAKYAH